MWRRRDIVLSECTRHGEGVIESRHIARRVHVAFNGKSPDPGLATHGSTHRHLAERRAVPIALDDFTELVVVALSCHGRACCHDVATPDQELTKGAGVEPL